MIEDRITPSQAALRLGLSSARVRQLADQGVLPSTRTALGRLIDAGAVERLRRVRLPQVESLDTSPKAIA